MGKSIKLLALPCVALAAAPLSAPAGAQYMPHLDPSLYANVIMSMSGPGSCGPMPQKEIDEARLPAPGIMQGYFNAAQSGGRISAHFKLNGKTRWTHGETEAGADELNAQSDPLAAPGNSLDSETVRFFRAGTHTSAQGQWLVRNADGEDVGVYNGQFERQKGEWRLHKLEIFTADQKVAPIMHYCSKPGDLDERRVNGYTSQVESLQKRVASRTRRYESAAAKFAEAQERAQEKPNSKGRAAKLAERRTLMQGRRAKLDEATKQLREANLNLTEARTDLGQLRSHTTEARNARAFRELTHDGKLKSEEPEEGGADSAQAAQNEAQ